MRLAFAAVLLVLASGPAFAQMETREGIALQNQILQLQQEVQSLASRGGPPSSSVYQGGGGAPANGDLVAQLLDRVSRLEDQVRDLRGRMDELQNTAQQQTADLNKQVGDLRFQVQNGAGAVAPSLAPPSLTSAPPASPSPGALGTVPQAGVRRPPELAMQEGNAALARRDYPTAEAAAREVLQTSARSPRAYDAQFLLAQSLLGQHNYQAAAVAYDDTYNRSRTGIRAQDSLLGLANALTGLNDRQAACGALDKLRMEFPNPRADIRAGEAGARGRAGCR